MFAVFSSFLDLNYQPFESSPFNVVFSVISWTSNTLACSKFQLIEGKVVEHRVILCVILFRIENQNEIFTRHSHCSHTHTRPLYKLAMTIKCVVLEGEPPMAVRLSFIPIFTVCLFFFGCNFHLIHTHTARSEMCTHVHEHIRSAEVLFIYKPFVENWNVNYSVPLNTDLLVCSGPTVLHCLSNEQNH